MKTTKKMPHRAETYLVGKWSRVLLTLLVIGAWVMPLPVLATPGVTKDTIRIGGVMDLKGDSRALGLGMQAGIEAALQGQHVHRRKVEYITLNDNYSPSKTIAATKQLINQGIFAMVGNVGTPTAKVSLPILAEHRVPAVGFFTGAGLLRPGVGDIINFRASYVQETAAVIESALRVGLKPQEVCAYVQNDAYGMAGVEGIKRALQDAPGANEIIERLDKVIAMQGSEPPRNNVGPIGVYPRNTLSAREGYQSLKYWEQNNGTHCRLVVSVGTYAAIARFIAYSRYKGEQWVVSAVSFTGADSFKDELAKYRISDGVVMTQVVPDLDSTLSIVKEAKKALGENFGYVSLEGYIVGKMLLRILAEVKEDLTRENFVASVRNKVFDLGGMTMDFTTDNQGSDFVLVTYLQGEDYKTVTDQDWIALFR